MPKTYADFVREALAVVREIGVAEARRVFDADDGTVFIDVREAEEVARGAIPGSLAIPRGILEGHVEDWLPEKDQPIVCYCSAGSRSALAARTLLEMGYENVKSLEGGFGAWAAAKHPLGAPRF